MQPLISEACHMRDDILTFLQLMARARCDAGQNAGMYLTTNA